MVDTGVGTKNIFRQVKKFQIADINHQSHGSFGLIGVVNARNQVNPNPLVVSAVKQLDKNAQ